MKVLGELAETGVALRSAALPAAASAVRLASALGLRSVPGPPRLAEALASDGGGSGDLARILGLMAALSSTAVGDTGVMGFREAADFAANLEEISRHMEYLQVVAAGAVERTRREAVSAARAGSGSGSGVGWTTGWGSQQSTAPDPTDDGCRNTTEFLRMRLRIGAGEARRRLALAAAVLPTTGITGHVQKPERPVLAAAVAAGTVASRAATIITLALDRVRHHAPEDTTAKMEHALTRAATEQDTDFVARVARQWMEAIDQDGSEPSEEELRRRQGVFLRQPRRGLQHFEVFATPEQFEPLLTAMNTATNPRTRIGDADTTAADALDLRTRPQRLLDGLVGASKAGLSTGALPAAGGLRPQVMVTIDYRDLLDKLEQGIPGTGSFTFTGPVTASTVRKIACDADIIPVLLGTEGRVLDIGRTTRIFPPHIRKAITARDHGCAFPGCTIPAPWCEAHHITYWSHGGATSTDNGTLLCSHHHHLIHKEQWQIRIQTGVPWFIPPPHIDTRQVPRRNHYFRLE
ncbi:HNH endonuclease signature motif containing protein [Arthrobacter sp. B10-11]|uniref:HNH endonuclease signature motif containing protein n=1 Tax=Arthrobacter sp. B10-11 TaxID=3081160 RepID=UPI002952B8BC|nr:DUF222 domain-containing protein [Arthrobacter sp. B10-11]MDV8150121.1 DUF222 domain-containing protein [Arthrobacter sp. B10-11]